MKIIFTLPDIEIIDRSVLQKSVTRDFYNQTCHSQNEVVTFFAAAFFLEEL